MASPWSNARTDGAIRAALEAAVAAPAAGRARPGAVSAVGAADAAKDAQAAHAENGAAARPEPAGTGRDGRDEAELARQFRHAMRRLTAAVSIVATREHGARYGMTATALSTLSTEPPAIVVCINRNASVYLPLARTRRFSVNLLQARQADLIAPFSGKLEHAARFAFGAWREARGLPVLSGAQATLLCRVDVMYGYGSHDLVIGRVEAVTAAESVAPLLWQNGGPAAASGLGA
ncbi:flavin reductase family protein [Burkholderia plantarii]|uniref:flavin reductase family protein n=1 Tax=Burkholderia plantarii TaxID=41899 RepID=UPI0006D8B888|nr:flavin reductase family protein [Burkholderia plantarii]ALK32567.1 Flavin reductase domain-containing protein [Burkholderia plantarii]GLZ19940.1 flavin reductase [Burkholderia plantarii]